MAAAPEKMKKVATGEEEDDGGTSPGTGTTRSLAGEE
jgi:hypothetical protein